jgi:hypothetical protein
MKSLYNKLKSKAAAVTLVGLFALLSTANAQTSLFQQNFNTPASATVNDFVDVTNPGSTKFNAIAAGTGASVNITGGALELGRTTGSSSFSRTTNLVTPATTGVKYSFKLSVNAASAATSVVRFQVGDGFSTSRF